MCYACWEDAGKPAIINDATLAAAEYANAVTHYGIDDWNLNDATLEAFENEPGISSDTRLLITRFRNMSLAERYSAMAIADGLLDAETQP